MPGKQDGTRVTTIPGYVVIETDGKSTQYPVRLRVADIPTGLTYAQVGAITTLANLIADLTKKLIELGVLDAEFTGEHGYDLAAIVGAIEDMGGDFGEPDLTVT